ncbi:ATP-binding cassette domain-containing protein [Lacticaseibacillus pabuli]|uniref:ATP-binding cassette domain-containing protein n=1 Tax=Lacticaseibacillus pabuli TaxID=3025672 RepID=A0ABY7WNZ1_9LACO|nr:ABC transporter ATP-binding protein/permease [Lacticaseibacillus sp. KACC 23028]WDF81900.1 ATP-binding cassette domain-containing protein [Lacticaseibacillus sp. KACC 23028]
MSFLELRNIRKSYFLGKEEFPVLKGIDLDFELGEFVSILGESGGGKSTLMNIIGGLDRNFEGQVTINGQKLDHKKEKMLDAYRRGTIGYIYQAYNLISHLTVLENVLVALDMTTLNRSERNARATDLLKQVGLADQMKKHPNQLSGGQKQRVAIARALAADPQVIIADEPTGALDSVNTAEVLTLLDDIAKSGKLVIAVTHSQEVADHGTRIVHLADGKIDGDERIKPAYDNQEKETTIPAKPLPAMASYRTAFKHLSYNFGRNFLIILGTAIGLFAVMLFMGLGNGVKGYINKQVTDLANPNYPTVMRNVDKDSHKAAGERMASTTQRMASDYKSITLSDANLKQLRDLKHVAKVEPGYQWSNTEVSYGTKKATIPQYQTWTGALSANSLKAGAKPGKGEIVVDKKNFAEVVYPKHWRNIVGKTVTVKYAAFDQNNRPVMINAKLKVSGVIDSGASGATVAASYGTMKQQLTNAKANAAPMFASVKVPDTKYVKSVTKKINTIKDGNKLAYVGISVGDMLDTINTFTSLATNVLAAIAGISLVVSALMIIVTMYMSVSERTKEIGILRALGESKRDIRRLFTSESLFIGLLAAVLGTVLAFGLGALLNGALYQIAKYTMIAITPGNVIFAFIVAIVISFLAALLPARSASRLNPIDALSAD